MTIIDFFDVYNIKHLVAYNHLCNTGHWPENFLPEDLEVPPPLWASNIMARMGQAWLEAVLAGKVDGVSTIFDG
jgi:hypothetical protein